MTASGISMQPLATPLKDEKSWTGIIWPLNLGKVGGSVQRLDAAEAHLWQGDVEGAIAQFKDWQHERVTTLVGYLSKHRQRIVNDGYYQAEGISIGSGAIESTVKQFGQRMKLAGAQWQRDNVPQVLKHRAAYLNGQCSK